MKQFVAMILTVMLLVGCGQSTTVPTSDDSGDLSTPTTENLIQEETAPMPAEQLSPELQQAVLRAVSAEQNVPADRLEITTSEAADWPDACLGLAGPDEMCAQMITPGWAITVSDGQQSWQYRTDLDVLQVRLSN